MSFGIFNFSIMMGYSSAFEPEAACASATRRRQTAERERGPEQRLMRTRTCAWVCACVGRATVGQLGTLVHVPGTERADSGFRPLLHDLHGYLFYEHAHFARLVAGSSDGRPMEY